MSLKLGVDGLVCDDEDRADGISPMSWKNILPVKRGGAIQQSLLIMSGYLLPSSCKNLPWIRYT